MSGIEPNSTRDFIKQLWRLNSRKGGLVGARNEFMLFLKFPGQELAIVDITKNITFQTGVVRLNGLVN